MLFISNSALSESLWGKTNIDMLVNDVLKKIDGAYRIDGSTLATNLKELVRKDNVLIDGNNFSASFYFDGEKLKQVTLRLNKDKVSSSDFDKFRSFLLLKYGKPLAKNDKDFKSDDFESKEDEWMKGNTNISINYIRTGSFSSLNINYQTRVNEALKNL